LVPLTNGVPRATPTVQKRFPLVRFSILKAAGIKLPLLI
jgi:hypothetical protein